MADIQSNIRVNIDTNGALASLKVLQGQISAFHQEMSRSGALAASEMSKLQNGLMNALNRSGQFDARMKTIKTTAESFTESLEKNKLSMGEYFRYAGAATKDFGKLFKNEFDTIEKVARERVKTLQTQYIKMGRDANGAMRAMAIRPLTLDLEDAGTKMQIAAQKQQLLNQLLKQGSTNMLNWGKNTQWAGRQLMVGFTVPLTMLGQVAAKTFMDMEQQALRFQRVYGDFGTTAEETKQMSLQVTELAKSFTKYGVAVSDTMGMAADAAAMGKQGADLLAQIQSASTLAVLGGVDQQKALETTISLTNAFGISADKLNNKINFLNAVENQSVLSIEDMTIAIPKAAPVIKQLGGDVEDLTFFLTAMKEGGINASEGANALKSGIASIINPTKKASDMLAGFGINIKGIVSSNKGNVRGMVMGVAEALNKLDPLKRAQAIEQLFGKFQFARISTLFKNITDVNSQASKVAALAAQGPAASAILAQRELDKIQQSPMFKFKKALEDLKVQLIPLGEQFLKMVTPIAQFFNDLLKNFNSLSGGTKDAIGGVTMWLAGFGPVLLMTIGLVANGIANIIKMFAMFKSFINGIGKGSQDLGSQTSFMTEKQLEASSVASSLDQVHTKLRQTFTAEAEAIALLRSEMEKAIVKQKEFGWTPTATAPTATKTRKKFASGGMVVGPGGPKDDLVPTDLSNGEAVIDAETVKKNPRIIGALFAGRKIQIPGYAQNNGRAIRVGASPATESTPSQYDDVFAHISEPIVMSLEKFVKRLNELGVKVPADIQRKLDMGLGKSMVKAYGGLGFSTRQSYNDAMKAGGPGVIPKDFLKDFQGRGLEKWSTSLKVAGLNMSEVADDLALLDKSIADQVKAAEKADKDFVVTDKAIAEFTEKALKPLREKGSKLAEGFDRASKLVTEIRGNTTQAILSGAGFVRNEERGKGYYTGPNGEIVKSGRLIKVGGGAKGKTTGGVLRGTTIEDLAVAGIVESTEQRSPSRKAKKAGEMIGVGALQGIEVAVVKARSQAQKDALALAAATRSAYAKDPELRNLAIRKKQAEMIGAETAWIEKEIAARKAAVAAEVKNAIAKNAEAAQVASGKSFTGSAPLPAGYQGPIGPNDKRKGNGFGSYVAGGLKNAGQKVMSGIKGMGGFGATMGVGMVMGGLSQMGGPVGQVAGQLMGPVTAVTGALTMLPGPLGWVAAGLIGVASVVDIVNKAIEAQRKKVAEFGNAISVSTKDVIAFSKATGTVSATEARQKAQETSVAGYKPTSASEKFGANFIQTDAGKQLLSDAQLQASSGMNSSSIAQNISSQLGYQIAQGTITTEQAKSIAKQIGDKLKNQTITAEIIGNMNNLFGPNGENIMKDPLKITVDLQQQRQQYTQQQIDVSKYTDATQVIQDATDAATGKAKQQDDWGGWNWLRDFMTIIGGAKVSNAYMYAPKLAETQVGKIKGDQMGTVKGLMSSQIQSYGSNQGSLDIINQTYDKLVAQATTQEEINNLEDRRKQSLADQLVSNEKIFKNMKENRDLLNLSGGNYDTDIFKPALENVLKGTSFEAQASALADKINGIKNKDVRLRVQAQAVSGDLDPSFINRLVDLMDNKQFSTDYNLMVRQSGDAKATELVQALSNTGLSDTAINKEVNLIVNGKESLDSVLQAYNQINQLSSIGISIDVNTTEGQAEITKFKTEYDALNDKVGKKKITAKFVSEYVQNKDAAKVINNSQVFQKLPKQGKIYYLAQYQAMVKTGATGPFAKPYADWLKTHKPPHNKFEDFAAEITGQAASAASAAGAFSGSSDSSSSTGTAPTKSDKANAALSILGRKEEKINKAYEERLKALDQIQKANERINQQKKDQLDLADALSKGDIGAAARAQQQARQNAMNNALQDQRDQMNAAKDAQINSLRVNGMSRNYLQGIVDREADKADRKTLGKGRIRRATGGIVPNMKYFSIGGESKGTDTVAAMLTPGEFVVKKSAVDKIGVGNMQKINNGEIPAKAGSVYNYSINVNVKSDADADQIANVVLTKIQAIDDQSVKGNEE